MEKKLFVGNLSYSTNDEALRSLFGQAGDVSSVELIKDRDTGQSKGFAFIEMGSQSDVENAIRMFNGFSLDNRQIKVAIAHPREERPNGGWYADSPKVDVENRNRRKPARKY